MKTYEHLKQIDHSNRSSIARSNLEQAIAGCNDKQKAYLELSIPLSQQRVVAESYAGKSLAKAIKAKCLTCCNCDKEEVQFCAVEICPLWSVRPYRTKHKNKDLEQEDDE